MGMPVGPWLPVLMVSVVPLSQQSWAGELSPVAANVPFWASSRDAPGLVAAGQAIYAPSGTIPPPVEPAYTAHGTPGFAAGTSNSSPLGQQRGRDGADGSRFDASGKGAASLPLHRVQQLPSRQSARERSCRHLSQVIHALRHDEPHRCGLTVARRLGLTGR
jgi:hypothetical protein